MDKTDLEKYITNKEEALKFWTALYDVTHFDDKIARLKREIEVAKQKLEQLR